MSCLVCRGQPLARCGKSSQRRRGSYLGAGPPGGRRDGGCRHNQYPAVAVFLSLNAKTLLTLPRPARANILNATDRTCGIRTVRTLQSVTMEDGSTRFETHHVFPQTSLASVPSLSWQTVVSTFGNGSEGGCLTVVCRPAIDGQILRKDVQGHVSSMRS